MTNRQHSRIYKIVSNPSRWDLVRWDRTSSRCGCSLAAWLFAVLLLPGMLIAQELPGLIGHTDPAYAAVYTADGSQLVTAAFDKSLKIWDLKSSSTVKTLLGHTGLVLAVALSPDQTQIVSGGLDNSVRLWDFPQRKPTLEWQPHSAATVLPVSADSQFMVTAASNGKVQFWNPADRTQIREIQVPGSALTHLALRPDKNQVAVADATGLLSLYQVSDGALQARWGAHSGPLSGLAYAPNGTYLLSAGVDGWVRRWPNNLPASRSIVAHAGGILAVRTSPNNQFVVTAGKDQTVRQWNLGNGTELRKLEGGVDVDLVAISNDSNRILTAGADRIARLYDAGNGQLVKEFPAAATALSAIAVAPDQQEVLLAEAAGPVKLFKIADASETRSLAGHAGGTRAAVYVGNQPRLVTTGADRQVRVWNRNDGNPVRNWELPAVARTLVLSPDQQVVAVGGEDQQARLYSLADGKLQHEFPAVGSPVRQVEFSRDQQHLAIVGETGRLQVWNVPQKRLVQMFAPTATAQNSTGSISVFAWASDQKTLWFGGDSGQLESQTLSAMFVHPADDRAVHALVIHPNSGSFATAGADGQVKLWDSNNANPIRQFLGHQGPVLSLAIRPDQQQLASGGSDQRLKLWNINDPSKPQYDIETPAQVVQLAYSLDSKKLVAAGSDHLLRSYDPTPLTPPPAQPPSQSPAQVTEGHTATITSLVWLNDHQTALSTAHDGSIRGWKIAAVGATAVLTGHQSQVYAVAWDPRNRWIASGSNDKTVKLWDVATRQNVRTFPAQEGAIYGLQFTADGQSLLTVGGDNTVRMYATETGTETRRFAGPTDAVYTLDLSPDGRTLAAAGLNRQVYLWDVASGQLQKTLTGHTDDIYRVNFQGSGSRLLSIGYGGNLRIWNPAQDTPLHSQKLPLIAYSALFAPNGQQIAVMGSDSRDNRVYLIDVPPAAR